MDEPKFAKDAIVRSSFFYQYFPDGYEAQNRFTVVDTVNRPRKGRVCLVKMVIEPDRVCEIREDQLEPAR